MGNDARTSREILLARRRGHAVTLPSGLEVKVRYLSPASFLQRGNIPNLLMPLVLEMQNGGHDKLVERLEKTALEDSTKLVEELQRYLELNDYVLGAFIVYPKIVTTPEPDNGDEMSLDELDQEDKAWLMSLVGLPARQLETFCAQSNELMERVLRGEDDAHAPVGADESGDPVPAVDGDTGDRPLEPVSV